MPLKITGRHPPLIDIAIYILIVHTEDIKYFSFLFHCRTGITENNRTRGIRSLHPIPAKLEICTINTFVTDTPKQDRRMRTESFHHFLTLSQITVGISRITLCITRSIILLPISINKANSRLTFHIDAITVTKLQEAFRRRIMGSTDKVHIRLLKEQYIQTIQVGSSGSP